ncbi:MAG: hypothetical protein J6T62_05880 [Fibrobacter sp.]|nr:hypothetical protein [Fibrobacter sp.]
MRYDILNIANCRYDRKDTQSFLVAIPAIAIECEVHPPQDDELDVYEETALKFISIGFSLAGIANALNTSETFIEEIYANLESDQFIRKTAGNPWELTDKGMEYLKGIVKDRPSDQAVYGYFFVNPIKKDILPFFYNGNLDQAPLFQRKDSDVFPEKITIEGDEENTFQNIRVKNSELKKAFSAFVKCNNILKRRDNDEISHEEAQSEILALSIFEDEYSDLDSFDEAESSIDTPLTESENEKESIGRESRLVKKLSKSKNVYLTVKITVNPSLPDGYKITSPFNMKNIDEKYYLRQMQWLKEQSNVFLGESRLGDYLKKEIVKLCRDFDKNRMAFDSFALAHMPHLYSKKEQFRQLYDDISFSYGAMQRNPSLREQKNVVRDLGSDVVENLLNRFFVDYENLQLNRIANKAKYDSKQPRNFLENLLSKTFLFDRDIKQWSIDFIKTALSHLTKSHGNGAQEKLANLLIVNYYNPTKYTKHFLEADNVSEMFKQAMELNRIRNLVSHNNTGNSFKHNDYLTYVDNIFSFADGLVAVFERN